MKSLSIQNAGFLGSKITTVVPTFQDDFTSYADTTAGDAAWPTSSTTKIRVNPTNDNIDFIWTAATANYGIAYDLTSVSDSAWILRFKIRFSTLTSDTSWRAFLGLSSVNQATSPASITHKAIGMTLAYQNADKSYGSLDALNATLIQAPDNNQAWTPATSTDYYVEIKRLTTTTYRVEVFTNSDYSTGSVGQMAGTCSASIIGLRYIKFVFRDDYTDTANVTGTIDDVKFYNGITSV